MDSSVKAWFEVSDTSLLVTGQFDYWLVVLSVLIAIFASYVAMQVASDRSNCRTNLCNRMTVFVGGLSLGGGVWSMHFVGMLAFDLCTDVSYDVTLTLLSMIPSVLASWLALHFIIARHSGIVPLLVCGTLVGAGIGVMHYVGMGAMQMAPLLRYDPFFFGLSILVAVALASLSLWIRFYLSLVISERKLVLVNILAGCVMGIAISGMHYVGMAAARFVLPPGVELVNSSSEFSSKMAVEVTTVAFVIIGIVLAITTISKYKAISEEVRKSEARLLAVMDSALDGIITINAKGTVVSINKATTRLLGWTEYDLVGGNVNKIVPLPFQMNHDGFIQRYLETGQAKIIGIGREVEAVHKSGEMIDVNLSIGHARLPNESYFVAFITDIRKRLEMERVIRSNEEKYRTLVTNLPGAAYRRLDNAAWTMVYISDAVEDITGFTPDVFLSVTPQIPFSGLIDSKDLIAVTKVLADDSSDKLQYQITRADGEVRWLMDHYKVVTTETGERYIDGFVMDITESVQSEAKATRFKALVDFSMDAIMSISLNGKILTWNDAAEELYGYTEGEILGRSVTILSDRDEVQDIKLISDVAQGITKHHYRSVYKCKNGNFIHVSLSLSPIYDADGIVRSISQISRDITDDVKKEEMIRRLAEHDHLTGLLNRNGFFATIESQVETAAKYKTHFALMFIDLDNFKHYNDTYGHDFGDALLKRVSETLSQNVRNTDNVGRMGGDEFVISINDVTSHSIVSEIAEKVIHGVCGIRAIDDVDVNISASVGVAIYPADSEDISTLFTKADKAMYNAKRRGKNQVCFYTSVDVSEQ